jgi:predicted MPP superfamily phosphohydrolase
MALAYEICVCVGLSMMAALVGFPGTFNQRFPFCLWVFFELTNRPTTRCALKETDLFLHWRSISRKIELSERLEYWQTFEYVDPIVIINLVWRKRARKKSWAFLKRHLCYLGQIYTCFFLWNEPSLCFGFFFFFFCRAGRALVFF